MVVPFIALLAVIILIVYFLVKAGKKKNEGESIGEPGKGTILILTNIKTCLF